MWEGTPIRTRVFRHTYCSARLQTLDGGKPVSTYTVRCELGHNSDDMVTGLFSLGRRPTWLYGRGVPRLAAPGALGGPGQRTRFGTTLTLLDRRSSERQRPACQ